MAVGTGGVRAGVRSGNGARGWASSCGGCVRAWEEDAALGPGRWAGGCGSRRWSGCTLDYSSGGGGEQRQFGLRRVKESRGLACGDGVSRDVSRSGGGVGKLDAGGK